MRLVSLGAVAPFLVVFNLYNVLYAAPAPKRPHAHVAKPHAKPHVKAGAKPNRVRFRGDGGWVRFKLTAYCPCSECCGRWSGGPTASGMLPVEGVTVAVDPKQLPLWSILEIRGVGVVIAEDTGSAVVGHHLDVFVQDHETAKKFGVRYAMVRVLQRGRGAKA